MTAPTPGPAQLTLHPQRTTLLIVDVQQRLAAAMPDEVCARVEKNIALLVETARCFELPVVVSEQYPQGLGRTTEAIEAALAGLGVPARRLEKVEFDVCAAPGFAAVWDDIGRDQWIVVGMEAHVCVYQTVRSLAERGAVVHVPGDAVVSRTKANWRTGVALATRAGAVVTSTEVVMFDLLRRAGSERFKTLSRLVR